MHRWNRRSSEHLANTERPPNRRGARPTLQNQDNEGLRQRRESAQEPADPRRIHRPEDLRRRRRGERVQGQQSALLLAGRQVTESRLNNNESM